MDSHRLVLHEHPFASYCQKALIALYELDLPFDTRLIVDEDVRGASSRRSGRSRRCRCCATRPPV